MIDVSYLAVLTSFFLASTLLALAPGPDNIFVLTQSISQGQRAGILVTLGLCSGLIFHTVLVAVGVAAIFQQSVLAFSLLSLAGAGYLLFLAWGSWNSQPSPISVNKTEQNHHTHSIAANDLSPFKLYRRGIVMNITNPKVTLFFLAFLPQFVIADRGPVGVQVVVLGGVFMLATLGVFSMIAVMAGAVGEKLQQSTQIQTNIQRTASVVFILLAIKLVFSVVERAF
ncbi:LysE family translocator [Marinibactrum halimedae]|uniref:Threonine transporter RhtB n=1 Tax=Marinibactrum halimedae TaxID=1444977 RepID=A0AA37T4V3_9GAMM|nr:LysE family translocator [Marinibactrum halimedae]MCD9458946.1 LysE family translocator [Marinibactrum halimedae]GLS26925.1 threonine transporter RhtB [Marinibactrum halimedae]